MSESGLYVGKEPATFEFEGSPVFIGPTIVVRAGHPILKGREDLFTPLVIHYDVAAPEQPEPEHEPEQPAASKPEPKAAATKAVRR